MPLDLLTATAGDLRQLLDSGKYTSEELVPLYLAQIASHNHDGLKLHAINAIVPVEKLVEEATTLDQERQKSGPRSPLQGIPITLKGLQASEDAAIATAVQDAGCIVIALANLSEWANCRGSNLTSGWSPVGGQTQSPYVQGGVTTNDRWFGHSTPAGSSSGSAVGTAAGFSAFSIGSESDGSVVQPAIRAALYSMKGTVGAINMKGTMSGGAGFDSAGPLTKSVEDCADVMDVLLPGRDFRSHLTESWEGITIAYLDYKAWQFPDWVCDLTPAFDDEHEAAMIKALKAAEAQGAKISYGAQLLMPDKIMEKYDTVPMWHLYNYELPFCMMRFLALFNNPELRTLEDLVEFNKNHADLELPPCKSSQASFESSLADTMTDEEYAKNLEYLRKSFRDAVETTLEETGADVIMASGESFLPGIAAGTGYPLPTCQLASPISTADHTGWN